MSKKPEPKIGRVRSDKPLKVKLIINQTGHDCQIEVNGVDLSNYTAAVSVEVKAGQATFVILALTKVEVEIEGEAWLEIPKAVLTPLRITPKMIAALRAEREGVK